MQSIAPQIAAPTVRVAETQPEYQAITVALVEVSGYWMPPKLSHNAVLMAFRPSEQERRRIAEGADLYIALLTYGRPQQPIMVFGSAEDAAGNLGLRVLPTESVPKMSPETQNAALGGAGGNDA